MLSTLSCCCVEFVTLYKYVGFKYLNLYNYIMLDWIYLSAYKKLQFNNDFNEFYDEYLLITEPDFLAFFDNNPYVVDDFRGGYASESAALGYPVPSEYLDTNIDYHWAYNLYYYYKDGVKTELFFEDNLFINVDDGNKIYSSLISTKTGLVDIDYFDLNWS